MKTSNRFSFAKAGKPAIAHRSPNRQRGTRFPHENVGVGRLAVAYCLPEAHRCLSAAYRGRPDTNLRPRPGLRIEARSMLRGTLLMAEGTNEIPLNHSRPP